MSTIHIIGLAPGRQGLTNDAWNALRQGRPLYLRTSRHPIAVHLTGRGITYKTFDRLFRFKQGLRQVYRHIARTLIRDALKYGEVYYAVPGNPMAGETAVIQSLSASSQRGIWVHIIPVPGFVDPLLEALHLDPLCGVTVLEGLHLGHQLREPCQQHLILARVYSQKTASGIRRALMKLYPADFPVTIIEQAEFPGGKIRCLPLCRLDCRPWFGPSTALYLPPAGGYRLGDLLAVMARLRRDCPWDRRQTHHSLRPYLVEEAYEVVAAIDQKDPAAIREELGDLLLQVVFHSQIAREKGKFTIYEVIEGVVKKLIRRHPHVFGDETIVTEERVLKRWQQIKLQEKGGRGPDLKKEGSGLPSLLKALKVQQKAAGVGFDWPTMDGAMDKLREEMLELEDACRRENWAKIEEELGDLMFATVNVSRFLKMNPELVLNRAIKKFVNRFEYVRRQVESSHRPFSSYSLEKLDEWWEKSKKYSEN